MVDPDRLARAEKVSSAGPDRPDTVENLLIMDPGRLDRADNFSPMKPDRLDSLKTFLL